jgi:hypothetical protein
MYSSSKTRKLISPDHQTVTQTFSDAESNDAGVTIRGITILGVTIRRVSITIRMGSN